MYLPRNAFILNVFFSVNDLTIYIGVAFIS